MKLRIKGNSIRFRLLQNEVKTLLRKGFISEETRFTPGPAGILYYGLIASADAEAVTAKFEGDRITVILPKTVADEWAAGAAVGIDASQNGLAILVEKDFVCPGRPDDPDNADAF